MIICNQCGNTIGDNLRFCTDCGAETPMFAAPAVRDPAPPTTIPYSPVPQTTNYQPQPPQPPRPAPPTYVLPRPVPHVPVKRSSNTAVWVLLSFGVLVLVVGAVVAVMLSLSRSNNANSNTIRDANLSTPPSTPTATGRMVICQYNGVHVRYTPSRTAAILTDINKDQPVRIIRESTNRDSVFIPSLKQTVEDNWSEVQFEMQGTSYHGWIFSGFLR
jgi:hypothetical protein